MCYQVQKVLWTGTSKTRLRPFFGGFRSLFLHVPYFLFCKMRFSASFLLNMLLDILVCKEICFSTGCLNSLNCICIAPSPIWYVLFIME